MTQGVLDLIQAIDSGDSQTIDNAFNAEMAARVSSRLDTMRQDMAQNMFKEEQVSEEVVQEETTEITFTEEELVQLEAYVQTEEFAQLDEDSKNTLMAYLNKTAE